MISPLSKDLIAGAIGASGGISVSAPSLDEVEQIWVAFAKKIGAKSLAELRAMPAEKLLNLTEGMELRQFPSTIDGYFFPKPPVKILAAGEDARPAHGGLEFRGAELYRSTR